MAYDIIAPDGVQNGYYRYHADLDSVKEAVEKLVKSGCPRSKIMLGIPSYARHERNPGDVKTYAELVDGALSSSSETRNDASGQQIFDLLYDRVRWDTGHLSESPRTVKEKVEYAYESNLMGCFFWELGQDKQHSIAPGGILLQAAAATVARKRPRIVVSGAGDASAAAQGEL